MFALPIQSLNKSIRAHTLSISIYLKPATPHFSHRLCSTIETATKYELRVVVSLQLHYLFSAESHRKLRESAQECSGEFEWRTAAEPEVLE